MDYVPSGCHFLTSDEKQGLWRSTVTYTDVGVGRGAHLWPRRSRLSLSPQMNGGVEVLGVVFSQVWWHLSVLCGVLPFQTPFKASWSTCSFLPCSEAGRGAIKKSRLVLLASPYLNPMWWSSGECLPCERGMFLKLLDWFQKATPLSEEKDCCFLQGIC